MTVVLRILRPAAVALIVAMIGTAGYKVLSIREDLDRLQTISQDNILWTATQMEVELLRFQRSLAQFASDRSDAALDELHQRFDILWSRVAMMRDGRVGEVLRRYDSAQNGPGESAVLESIAAYLEEIDPIILGLSTTETSAIPEILERAREFQDGLRLYTLRVVRSDTSASAVVRDRMRENAYLTGFLGLSALLISVLALFLVMRDNIRQREFAEINRRQAEAAEAASRAKSRFLTMMSHELRNPLNGILGPLALLGQSDTGEKHRRLIEKAQQSGRTMLRMLLGLLDYGDIQDERLVLKREAFRTAALAEDVRTALRDALVDSEAAIEVSIVEGVPDLLWGDAGRISQIFAYLGAYLAEPSPGAVLSVRLGHDGRNLIGDLSLKGARQDLDWKVDLLMGMGVDQSEAMSTEALGPLIARGLLASARGVLSLPDDGEGERVIRVMIPAESVVFDKIHVHLETRSAALETLYRAALRSERIEFSPKRGSGRVDVVLVDTTSVGEQSLMGDLRARFPGALFVSLGLPASPSQFDDIVETPHDMAGLRRTVLGRLAS